ncbi:MAG: family acetyltransferase [Chitinophagaceae bacterium]|nr:family acetyltransferase [Chitinophagaceae bacterium]
MPVNITIRKATPDDLDGIRQLFYDTVITVNKKDYTKDQVKAWSSGYYYVEGWKNKLSDQNFFVAELNKRIVGFASFTNSGYIDFMYAHKNFQSQGIATMLLETIEKQATSWGIRKLQADASLTARPFFQRRGYELIKENVKRIDDVKFLNSVMIKEIKK